MKFYRFLFSTCFLVLVSLLAIGQKLKISGPIDSAKVYRLELRDGSTQIGNILQKDSATIILRTPSIPRMEIPAKNIVSIEELDATEYKDGAYWFPNPHATRYLIGPSAFTLKKGEGYYQNTYIFLNSVNVGLSDNFSFGGGIEFISTFSSLGGGNFDPIFYLTPKVGFKVAEKVQVGGGDRLATQDEDSQG